MGWVEFVRDNRISHHNSLTFTLVGLGLFDVQRYDIGSGCPRMEDIEQCVVEHEDDMADAFSADMDSLNNYEPSETESGTNFASDEYYEPGRGAID
ncbi:hypothetical protein AAHA92_29515 [Salvia divinorum]|uniref:TF-B3 domain-containing protein n=1 Tax=Salvia divinorum TaxID=28513 RepID=A0ABD1FYM3_SALDI